MLEALENRVHIPSYHLRTLRDFLKGHAPLCETRERQRKIKITLRRPRDLFMVRIFGTPHTIVFYELRSLINGI